MKTEHRQGTRETHPRRTHLKQQPLLSVSGGSEQLRLLVTSPIASPVIFSLPLPGSSQIPDILPD